MKSAALLLAAVVAVVPAPTIAQSTASLILTPSPLSLVVMVGRWMLSEEGDRVYHVRVQARGNTESEARQEAYKRAIEDAIGSLVLAESVVVDEQVKRREIIEYSSGYIDRSKILSQYHDGRHFVVDMDVWVKHSRIADRLLSKSESTTKIDGERLQTQIETLDRERQQGSRTISAVLADYPQKAYIIRSETIETRYHDRRAQIAVKFQLDLDPKYLRALWETLEKISQRSQAGDCYPYCPDIFTVHMVGKHDRVFFNRWAWNFGFSDRQSAQALVSGFAQDPAAVRLAVLDFRGAVIHSSCHYWAELDGIVRFHYPTHQFLRVQESRLTLDGTFTLQGQIEIPVFEKTGSAREISLSVVKSSSCHK